MDKSEGLAARGSVEKGDPRQSWVRKLWSLPRRDARKRRFGIVRDQIWFKIPAPTGTLLFVEGGRNLTIYRTSSHRIVEEGFMVYDSRVVAARPSFRGRYHRRTTWWRLYMDRLILIHPWGMLRLHLFRSGDDDYAPHDHRWNFWTFPLRGYTEDVVLTSHTVQGSRVFPGLDENVVGFCGPHPVVRRRVKPFRLHFRPAEYRHRVLEPGRVVPTIVFASRNVRPKWGFWRNGEFEPFDASSVYDK